jgi:hypothetical protein
MGFIHLLTILIFVAQSCKHQTLSAITAKRQDTTQICSELDPSKFLPRKDYESLNSTPQSCRENQPNAQKKKQRVAEGLFTENETNIDSPNHSYERFIQKKQNSAFSPSTSAPLFRLLMARRTNGHLKALKTDLDATWNQTPLIPLSDHEIDQTLEAHPEEGIPINDDTERPESTKCSRIQCKEVGKLW